MARRAPNGVVVMFRQTLDADRLAAFDAWYASGSDDGFDAWFAELRCSPALFEAARRMNAMLDDATGLADTLPPEMAAVIKPIQQLLQQVCLKSVASIKQA